LVKQVNNILLYDKAYSLLAPWLFMEILRSLPAE